MSRNVPASRLPPSHPPSLLPHLQVLSPPDYAELLPLSSGDVGEGSIICVDVRAAGPGVVRFVYEHMPDLAQVYRYCPIVLLAPTDVRALLRTFHSRPFRRGCRAILVPDIPWPEILREALTEERSLPQDLAARILLQRRHYRLDRQILEVTFSLPRTTSLVEGLFRPVAAADTVATHLTRLRLPPASKLKRLGLAVRASMRLQRDPHTTIESVAKSLKYASGAAVSLLISRTFGATTREVREKLGWEWLMGRWDSGLGGGVLPSR